jgi:hypothetical protein
MFTAGYGLTSLSPKLVTNLIVYLIFSLVCLTLFASTASAQTANPNLTGANIDVSVSPVFFDFSVKPGDTIKDKLRLHNNSNTPLKLKVDIKKLTASNVRDADLQDPTAQDQFVSWIKFDTTQVQANPSEWVELPFTISVPQDASFGYYFAFSLTQDLSTTSPNQPTAVIVGSVAVPVLLNVKSPNAQVEGQLVEFKPKSFVNEFLPVDFSVRVKNAGNVHIKPRGNIFIRGGGGKDLAILEVNEGMGAILPQGSRVFESSWGDGFITYDKTVENGKEGRKLNIHWNKLTSFRFGPYTANLLMVYDNGQRDVTLEGTTSFWVLPYKAVIGLVVVAVALFLGVRQLLRSYILSQIKKARKE